MIVGFLGRVARRILESGSVGASEVAALAASAPSADLAQAIALHQSGRLDEARAGYVAVIAESENNPIALCMLGALLHQQGDSEAAVELMKRALDIDSRY